MLVTIMTPQGIQDPFFWTAQLHITTPINTFVTILGKDYYCYYLISDLYETVLLHTVQQCNMATVQCGTSAMVQQHNCKWCTIASVAHHNIMVIFMDIKSSSFSCQFNSCNPVALLHLCFFHPMSCHIWAVWLSIYCPFLKALSLMVILFVGYQFHTRLVVQDVESDIDNVDSDISDVNCYNSH